MRHVALMACLLVATVANDLIADQLKLNAESLIDRCVTRHLQFDAKRNSIQLQRGVLFEDDGPAAGFSYQPNQEKLGAGVRIKKQLIIPVPNAEKATLLVGPGGDLKAQLNGKSLEMDFAGKQGNYWQAYDFPPASLRSGRNDFVLWGEGAIWIARDDEFAAGSLSRPRHANRSAKRLDGGKTWNDRQLGTSGDIDGEYYVRVFLDQYQREGSLTTPVLDACNLSEKPIASPAARIGPIRIQADVETNSKCNIDLRARTGTTWVPSDASWSAWAKIKSTGGVLAKPRGRFVQLKARFTTSEPSTTPLFQGLTIAASPERPADWTDGIDVTRFENQPIIRSSVPFSYEPFDQPALATLRSQYKLDKVVAGVKTEFELIKRLAVWSATRFEHMHLKEFYPAYNALEILKPHADGTPVGGFCQQSNVVFLQACESFGLVGRLVSLGPGNMTGKIRSGHETVEIWSNEYAKWIYIDGNTAWYAVDAESKVPLSLWELRRRQLAAFSKQQHRPVNVVTLAETRFQWPGLADWPPFVELRLIPRSNFLEQSTPLPLNQGMRGWFWTGHFVWSDREAPARMLYGNRIENRNNFQWTINRAWLHLSAPDSPGIIRVQVDTHTPGFAEFVITRNDETTILKDNAFEWTLQSGINTLRVAPRNQSGRMGTASAVQLSYTPAATE